MSYFEKCYEELKGKVKDIEITPQTIIKVLRYSMEIVEASEAKGEEQKKLVEKLVKQVVIDAPITDEKEKLLLDMIEQGILGDMASLVVSAMWNHCCDHRRQQFHVGLISVLRSGANVQQSKQCTPPHSLLE